jgi:MFS family permease
LLRLAPAESFALFSVVAMLVCAAMLPVLATRMAQPVLLSAARIGARQIFRIAPAAAAGALFSGLTIGAFWGLGPVYAGRLGLGVDQVAIFMTTTIIGGALLQWPVGRLSDSGDRRRMLAIACAGAALAAGFAMLLSGSAGLAIYAVFFLYGGLSFAVYPVAVAHLLDHVGPEDLLPACSTVLLLHGVGAALGPALAGFAMARFGAPAFPGYLAFVHLAIAAYVLARLLMRRRRVHGEAHFHPMLRTSPAAMKMLPEAEAALEDPA